MSTFIMDRSVIGPWKAEEKELSERLYLKLRGLTLLHTPTEEFRKYYSEDMFLKPNQLAFFHVMHFLFRVYDANEFRKRFYWPLIDKRSESLFRSSTVEFLKHISDKHNLQWNIKSYLVVMPGGIKFISFLLDFINLIVKEITTQREKQLQFDVERGQTIDWNLKRLRTQNELLKEFASKFITDVDALILNYNEKNAIMRDEFSQLAKKTGVSAADLANENFLMLFQRDNHDVFTNKLKPSISKAENMKSPVEALNKIAHKIHKKDIISTEVDNGNLCRVLNILSDRFPEIPTTKNDEVTMNTLMTAFNCIQPEVMDNLEQTNAIDCDGDFLRNELINLRTEYQEVAAELNEFQKMMNVRKAKDIEEKIYQFPETPLRELSTLDLEGRNPGINTLLAKYVCTPPIKLDLNNERVLKTRIAFLDDPEIQNSFLSVTHADRKPFKHSFADQTFRSLNNTMNKSGAIDPAIMLRSLQKSNKKSKATTGLKTDRHEHSMSILTKWRDNERLFDSLKTNTTLKQVDFSFSEDLTLKTHTTKLSAVKKVQKDSFNLHNLSTSPSGRLECLMPPDQTIRMLPNLRANNSFLNETMKEFKDVSCENNPNILNTTAPLTSLKYNDSADEELFNISDSVLKDTLL